MSISSIGKTGSDNYELISSVTPTAAAAAVNFTGLGLYKKLILIYTGVTMGSSGDNTLRFNNDSSSLYSYYNDSSSGASAANGLVSAIKLSEASASTRSGYMKFSSTDTTGVKLLDEGYDYVNARGNYRGVYLGTSVISQVNFITSSTFAGAGTVSLYGVK